MLFGTTMDGSWCSAVVGRTHAKFHLPSSSVNILQYPSSMSPFAINAGLDSTACAKAKIRRGNAEPTYFKESSGDEMVVDSLTLGKRTLLTVKP